MQKTSVRFKITDIILLILTVLPLVGGMILKVLTSPASNGIEISGAHIYFTVKMPVMDLPITESQVNSWLVIVSVFFLCLYITHGLTAKADLKRQILAEWIIEKTENMVNGNMGEYFSGFAPFIAAVSAPTAMPVTTISPDEDTLSDTVLASSR